MSAGKQDVRVVLQRFTATQNEYGEEAQTWADLAEEYAQVFYGRGDERRQAAMEQGTQAATFRFWATDVTRSLTLLDRIVLDGLAWDINGITPAARQHVEVTAVRVAP